ncbi:MAG: hypothetical protein WCH43_15945 [Verrucomicrobiota bacterium]
MGNVVTLPKHSRASREQAEQLRQYAFDLELSPEARAELDNALHKITETPGRRWLFVMINPEQFRFVTKAVQGCRNVATTLAVWNTAISYIRMDTGEIMASREKIAEDAGTQPCNVSTAISELVKIGAIVRQRRGRRMAYFVNPNVGWNGGEGARQEAAKEAPQLRLV